MISQCFKAVFILSILAGCAAKPVVPGSENVLLSKEPAPTGCEFLGEVQGQQGGLWSSNFTSDSNLINGARNEIRNSAYAQHANYVKIETESFSHNTADNSLGGTYSAVVIGNAYRCSEADLAMR